MSGISEGLEAELIDLRKMHKSLMGALAIVQKRRTEISAKLVAECTAAIQEAKQ